MENLSKKSPTISLIIPAYNEEKYITDCLIHVLKNSGDKFLEVLVIDNASTDMTSAIAARYDNVRIVREDKKGLTSARQRGFLAARGDILAFVDADTLMPSGWAEKVTGAFEEDSSLCCLSGPYIYYDSPKFQQFLAKWFYWRLLAMPIYFFLGYMAVGGNFAIKKSVVEKMGGFDTSIEFYGEDTDIARRAHKFGKVKFMLSLAMPTSARRLSDEGFIKTAVTYVLNFLSEVILKKPYSEGHKDIR